MRLAALLALTILVPCSAQKLSVYSPLTRVDTTGEIVKPDRGQRPPRHILSPGIPRNAWSSLRIAVEMTTAGTYVLDIGQNPENAVKATLYKEIFHETPQGWIPDGLQKVDIPYKGTPADFRLPAQRVATFWLDMWVDRNADVDRIKIEPQLYVDLINDWVVYPMEVRVQFPVVPDMKTTYAATLPSYLEPADSLVRGPLRAAMCGAKPEALRAQAPEQPTARDLLRRNVLQQLALAKDPVKLKALFLKATGISDAKWCAEPTTPAAGPEWYLRLRDAIYREAGAKD